MKDTQKKRILSKLQSEIEALVSLTEEFCHQDVSVHEMEKSLFKHLLLIGYMLLVFVLEQKIIQKKNKRPQSQEGEKIEKKGFQRRKYLSLFGMIAINRPSYWSKLRGKLYVLDEDMDLPKDSWSYNIQEMVGENASENDFRESVRLLNKLLDLNLSGKGSERNAGRLGKEVGAYYDSKAIKTQDQALCFSASFDGKGVPKIKPAKPQSGNPKKRLGKGEKKGIMQMATVSVTSCFEPKKRTVQNIIEGLMGSSLTKIESDKKRRPETVTTNDNRWHQNIHQRAFLADQAKGIEYGLKQIKAQMKNPQSRFVVPIDAGIGLEDKVLQTVKDLGLEAQFGGIILDIIHVSEYVWNAATAVFGEKSKLRTDWVREVLKDLLNSKTQKVIQDLELIKAKGKLSKNKIKQLTKTITYFTNHQHKMDYKTCREKGYPVSSALVEAACGHLVKQRMEQSGMRWSSQGAQNIMDLRAVKLNGDMEDFMDFFRKNERPLQSHLVT